MRFPDRLCCTMPRMVLIHVEIGPLVRRNKEHGWSVRAMRSLGRRVVDIVHDKTFGQQIEGLLKRVSWRRIHQRRVHLPQPPTGAAGHEVHLASALYGPDGHARMRSATCQPATSHASQEGRGRALQLPFKAGRARRDDGSTSAFTSKPSRHLSHP